MEGQKLWRDPNSKDPCDHGWGSYNANQIEQFLLQQIYLFQYLL